MLVRPRPGPEGGLRPREKETAFQMMRGFWCRPALIAHLVEHEGEEIRNPVGTEVPENERSIPSVKWGQ